MGEFLVQGQFAIVAGGSESWVREIRRFPRSVRRRNLAVAAHPARKHWRTFSTPIRPFRRLEWLAHFPRSEDKRMCWFSTEYTNQIIEAKTGQRLGIKQMH